MRRQLIVIVMLFCLVIVTGSTQQRLVSRAALHTEIAPREGKLHGGMIWFDPAVPESLLLPPQLVAATPADSSQLYLIQFSGPIEQAWLDQLRQEGVEPIHYHAENGYLVWVPASSAPALKASPQFITFVIPYHPYFKLGSSLLTEPALLAVGDVVAADSASALAAYQPLELTVQLYRHPGNEGSKRVIEKLSGGEMLSWTAVLNYEQTQINVSAADLHRLSQLPDLVWVEEALPMELLDEVQGQILAADLNGDQSGPAGPGYFEWLIGLGFSEEPVDYDIIDIVDDGLGNGELLSGDPTMHRGGNLTAVSRIAYIKNCTEAFNGESTGGHGHINGSIAAGYDLRAGFPYQDLGGYQRGLGINPNGRLGGTRIFGPNFSLAACENSYQGLIASIYRSGAEISSNSWGCSSCALNYTTVSQAFDLGTRDADLLMPGNQPLFFLFSAGNSGPNSGTIGAPGNGKNMLTVGASENFRPADEDGSWVDGCFIGELGADDAMDTIYFSSRGPAPGGRTKPEMTAPGTHVQGTASSSSRYSGSTVCNQYRPSGQTVFAASSGTSHSTPAVAGAASLVEYWLRENPAGNIVKETGTLSNPSPALIKAYLMNHPTYLTGQSGNGDLPDNNQGYGMPNLSLMFDQTPKHIVDQTIVLDNSGESWRWQGAVADVTQPVRIMLNYSDAAGPAGIAPQVNNLDLTVEIAGLFYLGNQFSGSYSIVGGEADALNNYEAIFLPAGSEGLIEIVVTGVNIAGDGVPNVGDGTDQDFALVCSNCIQEPDFSFKVMPKKVEICAGETAVYGAEVGSLLGYKSFVDLTVIGAPPGAAVTWTPPRGVTPFSSTLAIRGGEETPAGQFLMQVEAEGDGRWHQNEINLNIVQARPPMPILQLPENGAINVPQLTSFSWSAVAGAAGYELQLARLPDESNLIATFNTTEAEYTVTTKLRELRTYYWRVRARNVCGESNYSAWYAFTIQPVPPVLLVDDDDNAPDVQPYYRELLDLLLGPQGYDVWDTGGTNDEPNAFALSKYETVIWFTGELYGSFSGPGPVAEDDLGDWLEQKNCLFLSSQDYYDNQLTPFMDEYLGVESIVNYASLRDAAGVGLFADVSGPYKLDFPFNNYSDNIVPDSTAELAFISAKGDAGISKDNGIYRTVYLGFPLEALPTATLREHVLLEFLNWCGIVIESGVVAGVVTDGVQGIPLSGVQILADDGETVRETMTNAAGAYSMTLQLDTYTMSAAIANYLPMLQTGVVPLTETVTAVDFSMSGSLLHHNTERISVTLVAGQAVTRTIPLSVTGPFSISYHLLLDQLHGTAATFSSMLLPEGEIAVGLDIFADTFNQFSLSTPMSLTVLADGVPYNFYAADFLFGDYSQLYAIDNASKSLFAVAVPTGTVQTIGAAPARPGEIWSGMSHDPVTGIVYASSTSCERSSFYTIDLESGWPTFIGDIAGYCIIDIAINGAGQLFAVDIIEDQLLLIERESWTVVPIGPLGFDANFAQGLDFANGSGELYMAAFNLDSRAAELHQLDLGTGEATMIGPIGAGGGVEMDAFAIADGNVPWVAGVTHSAVLDAGGTGLAQLVFTADAPGAYSGRLTFAGNYVNEIEPIWIEMHVTPMYHSYMPLLIIEK